MLNIEGYLYHVFHVVILLLLLLSNLFKRHASLTQQLCWFTGGACAKKNNYRSIKLSIAT